MRYGVGIDLGTSFTSAAVSDSGGTRMVPMAPEMVVPAVAYPAADGALQTGYPALSSVSSPALAARNFKRRLGDPTPLVLGGSAYSPAALMAAQLRDVLAAVTRYMGAPPESVTLTYPAIWGPYRREHFTEVPRLAGVNDFRLITEPEAAAAHYSRESRLGDGEVVAVYDLGGGTFDTTILRVRSGRMEILGTPEGIEHLGGVDFDEALLAHIDERLDGAISELDTADSQSASALATIQTMCVRAKEELSIEPDVTLTVPLPSGPQEVVITRLEFNEMIRPAAQLTTEALHRTIASAGLRTEDLSAVLLAGGSSRVPLISQMVAQEFNKPVRVTLDPKFTVALGAALTSTQPRPATASAPAPQATLVQATSETAEPTDAQTVALRPVRKKKRWLVPAVAAAAALVIGGGAAIFALPGSKPAPLQVFNGQAVDPFVGFIMSDVDSWTGSAIAPDGAVHEGVIKAAPDPGSKGLHVTWLDDQPSQVYLQTAKSQAPLDLSPHSENGGALVFNAVVHTPPTGDTTTIAMHCGYPCGSDVPATELFANLPQGQQKTVKLPLSCFVTDGLDPKRVDTPFLVRSERRMDITFSDVRLEAGADDDADAMSCGELE